MNHRHRLTGFMIALLASTSLAVGQERAPSSASEGIAAPESTADPLESAFVAPPMSARPRVWWHWMNGNITEEGIRKDLEWMHRIGIGGLQNFDASLATPQVVDKRLVYMTPEWKKAFRYAVGLADRYDMELGIAASPGWSETGGPWVKPQDAMKKLVWSEAEITGGSRFIGKLPAPPSVSGPYQTIPYADRSPVGAGAGAPSGPSHYADAAVLAYPVADLPALPVPAATSLSGKAIEVGPLIDNSPASAAEIELGGPGKPPSITYRYASAQTMRSASLFLPAGVAMFGNAAYSPELEVREGEGWRKIADFRMSNVPSSVSFAPVTGTEFRVVLKPFSGKSRVSAVDPAPGSAGFALFGGGGGPSPTTMAVGDFRLSPEAKVDNHELKAGYAVVLDYYELSKNVPDMAGVDPSKVIDLTSRMAPDGTLDWTPPKGKWRVLRMGSSLLGTVNSPATPEATGLEVDKYDADAVSRYINTYLDMYRDAAGSDLMGKRGLRAIITDSFEAGDANWSPKIIAQFERLRGYDPTPWLPALTGVIIGSRAKSDAFLYDFRKTLGDLLASEHYGTVARIARERGLTVYGEALEDSRPALGDDIALRRHTDIPTAAMWTHSRTAGPRPTLVGDIKGAASVAHVYGQNLVAAESMTSGMAPWAHAPNDLKRIIDLEFVLGVNRPLIHTSVHQPLDDKVPGISLAIFGQYFNRHETWAEMAKPWVDYIARSSYLLQQGRNFADIAFFYGEEAPLTAQTAHGAMPGLPTRYQFDYVNPDILLNQLTVENGVLVARSGARYEVLYLGGSSRKMTLPTLQRIAALAESGATVIGMAPESSPALTDDKVQFEALVRKLWTGAPVTMLGRGRVIASSEIETALGGAGIQPDFDYAKPKPDSEILFLHRKLSDGDVYFLTNRHDRVERIDARFRVTGKVPELWNAQTGATTPLSYRIDGKHTIVPMELLGDDAAFVVFRKPASQDAVTVPPVVWQPAMMLDTNWRVTFQRDRGAPDSAVLPVLKPLNEHAEPGIKYFSGVAKYSSSFTLPNGVKAGAPMMLDLGKVGDVAEVWINGRLVETAWRAPYRVDVGKAVKPGRNDIEIRVANLWVNRLVGDAQPGATKITWTSMPSYQASAPLRPSGLIGPVQLLTPLAR